MKIEILRTLPAAAVFVIFNSAVSAQTPAPMPQSGKPMQGQMMQGSGHGSEQMKKSMMSGMDGMRQMPMSGDSDKDFAMMMKMHHQQALDMAQVELEHGKSAEMKAMARKIIAAQKKEIAQFDKWLAKQK